MRSWKTMTAITVGVTAIGLVAGAGIAAPDQLLPLLKWVGGSVASGAVPWLERMAGSGQHLVARLVADQSPRGLAMLAAGVATLLLAGSALAVTARNSKRSPAARLTTAAAPLSGVPRRAPGRSTPKQVCALAEQGSSLADIARRTRLPLDAITLVLAMSDPARQLPPSSA